MRKLDKYLDNLTKAIIEIEKVRDHLADLRGQAIVEDRIKTEREQQIIYESERSNR